MIAFSGFVFAVLFKDYELGWLAVLAALASGLLVGLVNGFLVAVIGIPSIIATLGTQFFWAGMATVLSGGKSYALRGAEDSSVWQLLVGRPQFTGDAVLVGQPALGPGAVDRRWSSCSCGSCSTATASASTSCSSATATTWRAWSASTSCARRSSCSR